MMLTAEEILAGSRLTFDIEVPEEILDPGANDQREYSPRKVRLRPLTVSDLQIVTRAAKESDSLLAALMVQRSLVEPEMSVAQVAAMQVGLMQFLLHQVNRISGVETTADLLSSSIEAPLAKAMFILAREFGWTPQQINELTLGQMLLHLQMLKERARA